MALLCVSFKVIVNFDDDDLYAPAYITQTVMALLDMILIVAEMRRRRAEALTLSSWFWQCASHGRAYKAVDHHAKRHAFADFKSSHDVQAYVFSLLVPQVIHCQVGSSTVIAPSKT
eukprot:1168484-Amphidinium_carterae.1